MKQVYIAAAAALAIGGFGSMSPALACGPGESAPCGGGAPATAQPTAAAPQHSAEHARQRPLQLHPAKAGTTRHVASRVRHHHSRSTSHRVAAKSHHSAVKAAEAKPPQPDAPGTAAIANTTPIQPKQVPTVAVAAPPFAVTPGQQAVGFAASHEPWSQVSAFASTETPSTKSFLSTSSGTTLPDGLKVVPNDEVNALDRAADTPKLTQVKADAADAHHAGAESVEGAKAAAATNLKTATTAPAGESWTGWLYRVCASGVSAAASAIRAVLM